MASLNKSCDFGFGLPKLGLRSLMRHFALFCLVALTKGCSVSIIDISNCCPARLTQPLYNTTQSCRTTSDQCLILQDSASLSLYKAAVCLS